MADPLLTLKGENLSVEPGGQVRVEVKIHNPGNLVEGYRLDVVGDGVSGWAEVVPPEVSVYPKQGATAVVVISPPSGVAAPSGMWPYGVRARSLVDPNGSAVVEGQVEVGKVFGLQAKLVPVTSTGRWRGRHVLHFSNWGNSPVKLTIVPSDPDNALGYLVRPPVLELTVGSQATARLWVRGRRPVLRGNPVRVPFTVVGEREGAATPATPVPMAALASPDRPVVDGALNQKPILSRAALTLGLALLAFAIAGIAWGTTRKGPGDPGFVHEVAPLQPKIVRVVGTGPTTINVTWEPVEHVRMWEIRALQGEDGPVFQVGGAEPAQTSKTVEGLSPNSRICFRVVAQGFGQDSPPSDPVCATTLELAPTASPSSLEPLPAPGESALPTTAAPSAGSSSAPPPGSPTASPPVTGGPSPSDSASPTGSPTTTGGQGDVTGKWFVASYQTAAASSSTPDLQAQLSKLRAAGLNPILINSGDTQYANLEPLEYRPKVPAWMVIVGPYASPEEAGTVCPRVMEAGGLFCRVMRPKPF